MESSPDSFHDWKELTCSQDQIYLSDVHYGCTPMHNLTFAFLWEGPVDIPVFQQAFQRLVREADCLRVCVREIDGRARQSILPRSDLSLHVMDFSDTPSPEQAYSRWAQSLGHQPLQPEDLIHGSWLAVIHPRRAYWITTLHHLVTDSWGIYLLNQRLRVLYEALLDGREPEPTALPPLQHLIDSDVEYRNSEEFHRDQAFWREYLKEAPGRINLYGYTGAAKVIPVIRKFTHLPQPVVEQLRQRLDDPDFGGRTANVALFNLIFTAFAAYLYRISGQTEFTVAVPYLNRPGDLRDIPGLTIQAAPIRVEIRANDSFRDLFERIREHSKTVAQHSRYPIPNPDNSRYNVMFNFHNRPYPGSTEPVETWWFNDTETVDLSLNILNPDLEQNRLPLGFDLPEAILENVGAETVFQHFTNILQAMLADPDSALDRAVMLSEVEQRSQLGGADKVSIPDVGRVFTLAFPEQVARSPHAVALEVGARRYTYAELHQRTDALAAELRARGVRPGTPVGMFLEDRLDMVLGLIGIMKSGGLYVPLDPTYPDDRLAYMLQDAGIEIMVSEPGMQARAARFTARQVHIHDLPPAPAGFAAHIPAWDDAGYITYTSGSTGRPKGVVTSHGALANDTAVMRDYLKLTPDDRFLFFAAIGFDAAFEEMLPALISGATVVPRPGGLLSADEFSRLLREERITSMSIPAAFWSEWVAGMALNQHSLPDDLKKMMLYAEEPNIQSFITWSRLPGAEHVRCINTYGPTEAAITTTMFEPSAADGDPAGWSRFPIGRPLPNHSVYVLDRSRNMVARGVPGELYIGGDTALRYQNMPDESAAVFLPDPFRLEPGKTMYKTGDRVRILPSGELEFLGRFDNQVKLHGFRIELGEIETRLAAHPSVKQAVVQIKGQPGATQRLVAYVVPSNGHVDAGSVRDFLHETLPAYMLPSDFVMLKEFPVTPNGKIDKKALPEPDGATEQAHEMILPETNLEVEILAIWEDVLGVTPISVTQDYFALGGNSLLGVRIFSQLENKLGLRLPVSELFRSPTVRRLARYIEDHQYSYQPSTVILLRSGGSGLPLFMIHGWGGGVVGYAQLIQALDPRWPVYGVQAAGLGQGEQPDTTMEAMVERYIRAIKQVQPNGPYRLGGYCTGGIIAYAVACELVAQGDAVDLIANIEGEPPHIEREKSGLLDPQRIAKILESIPYWFADYRQLGLVGIQQRLLTQIRGLRRKLQFRNTPVVYSMEDIILDDTTPLPDFQKDLLLKQVQMMEHYQPKRYPGSIVNFIARYPTITGALTGPLDVTLGWEHLVEGGLSIHVIDSGHRNIHLQPYCGQLAAAIQTELEKADQALAQPVEAPLSEA